MTEPPKDCEKSKQGGEKWTFIAGKVYEFTLNFNDSYQYGNRSLNNRIDHMRDVFVKLFDDNDGLQYCVVPEIEAYQFGDKYKNTVPRYHLHGIVYFKTKRSILVWLIKTATLSAKIGRYQFNDFREDYWPQYCAKHKDLFKHLNKSYYLNNDEELRQLMEIPITQ